MSLGSLLIDSGSKGWADVFIDSLKVYNDLMVFGQISQEGDLTLKGKLLIDGSNNPDDNAIEITGGKDIYVDGELKAGSLLFHGNNSPLSIYDVGSINLQTGGSFVINSQSVQFDFVRIGNIISVSFPAFSIPNADQNPVGALELIPPASLGSFQPNQTFEIPIIVRSNVSGMVGPSVPKMGAIQWNGSAFVLIPEIGTGPNWYQDNDNQSGIEARIQFQFHD